MTYTRPTICIMCGNPTSMCDCTQEVLDFFNAHVTPMDEETGIVNGKTLHTLILRAQAWGREKSFPPEETFILQQQNAELRKGWLALRQRELISTGMKIEQARIHADVEMVSALSAIRASSQPQGETG